jgi:hypothetical protein
MKKEVIHNVYNLNILLNCVISSAKIKTLTLPTGKQIIPQIHCIIYGGLGTNKSGMCRDIADKLGMPVFNHFTKAHIYGSVDSQTKTLIEPIIWFCRNSSLIIDEYDFESNNHANVETMLGLLDVLISQKINKQVGFFASDVDLKDEDDADLFLKVSKSRITCRTRFSCIINTMMDINSKRSHMLNALKSRCLVIPHNPRREDLFDTLRGKEFFVFKLFKVREHIKISKKDYEIILVYAEQQIKQSDSILRCVGDMCRVFAIMKEHIFDLYDTIIILHS